MVWCFILFAAYFDLTERMLVVDTDQTKDMDKRILQHQQENVPLRRFAQVRTFVVAVSTSKKVLILDVF